MAPPMPRKSHSKAPKASASKAPPTAKPPPPPPKKQFPETTLEIPGETYKRLATLRVTLSKTSLADVWVPEEGQSNAGLSASQSQSTLTALWLAKSRGEACPRPGSGATLRRAPLKEFLPLVDGAKSVSSSSRELCSWQRPPPVAAKPRMMNGRAAPEPKRTEGKPLLQCFLSMNAPDWEKAEELAIGRDVNVAEEEFGWMPHHFAGHHGKAKLLAILLEEKASAEEKCHLGNTALQLAARAGHVTSVGVLIGGKANIETQNEMGWNALMWAAMHSHIKVAALLLGAAADIEARDAEGRTAPMWAARHGNLDTFRLFLDTGFDLQAFDNDGLTVMDHAREYFEIRAAIAEADSRNQRLLEAAQNGDVEAVKCALAEGAFVDARDEDGRTALSWAAHNGSEEIIRLLAGCGASPAFVRAGDYACGMAEALQDALAASERMIEAAKTSDWLGVARAILQGACIYAQESVTLRSPLMRAAGANAGAAVQHIAQAKAKLEARDEVGWSALHFAAQGRAFEAVSALFFCRADPNVANYAGDRALHVAAKMNDAVTTQLLLAARSEPNALNVKGDSPLLEAAKSGSVAVATTLLRYGVVRVDNPLDGNGQTAFASACAGGHYRVARAMTSELPKPPIILPKDQMKAVNALTKGPKLEPWEVTFQEEQRKPRLPIAAFTPSPQRASTREAESATMKDDDKKGGPQSGNKNKRVKKEQVDDAQNPRLREIREDGRAASEVSVSDSTKGLFVSGMDDSVRPSKSVASEYEASEIVDERGSSDETSSKFDASSFRSLGLASSKLGSRTESKTSLAESKVSMAGSRSSRTGSRISLSGSRKSTVDSRMSVPEREHSKAESRLSRAESMLSMAEGSKAESIISDDERSHYSFGGSTCQPSEADVLHDESTYHDVEECEELQEGALDEVEEEQDQVEAQPESESDVDVVEEKANEDPNFRYGRQILLRIATMERATLVAADPPERVSASKLVNLKSKDGCNCLLLATKSPAGHLGYELAKFLLDRKADMSERDKDGITALMHASKRGAASMLEALLEAGADAFAQDPKGKLAIDYSTTTKVRGMLRIHMVERRILERQRQKQYTKATSDESGIVDLSGDTLPRLTRPRASGRVATLRVESLPKMENVETLERLLKDSLRTWAPVPPIQLDIVVHPITKVPTGLAYLDYGEHESAQACLVQGNGAKIGGSTLKICREMM